MAKLSLAALKMVVIIGFLVDVELRPFVKIIYCDRLAWQPPPDIIDVVNDFVRYIPQVKMFKKSHLVLAHSPSATNWQRHECDWRCRNYALQNCSDICGVITLVNAAVVTLCSPLFQGLTGPMIRELIRVLMSWFAEGRIEIDYVLPPVGWSGKNPEKSDHTFCSRPNNATKSSLDRPPPKKSPPSAANLYPVKSSPLSSSPTQCNETKPSQCSGKHPLPKCKPTDGNVAVSSPTPKRSSEGSSRLTVKKRKLSRLSNKRLANMPRKTEDTIAQQPPKLCKDSEAQSTEQSPSSSTDSNPTRPTSQFTTCESKEDSSANNSDSPNGSSISSASKRTPSSSTSSSATTPEAPARFQCPECGLILSNRNCLYKHKLRKHKSTVKEAKAPINKHIVCPECKTADFRYVPLTPA